MRQKTIATLAAVRSISPIGAATIFAIAYLAGLAGSVTAFLVAAALFVGLYAASKAAPTSTLIMPSSPIVERQPTPFEQLTEAGLICSQVTFKQPTQQRSRSAAP